MPLDETFGGKIGAGQPTAMDRALGWAADAAGLPLVPQAFGTAQAAWRGRLAEALSGAGGLALAMAPMAMGIRGVKSPPIRAYHASPYDFEAFDPAKIGSGQGAASYGHGFYAAESPAVSGPGGSYDREFTAKNLGKADLNQGEETILRALRAGASDMDVIGDLAAHGYTFDEALHALNSVKGAKSKIYDVSIHADPQAFLNWDAPATAQPKEVLDALGDIWQQRGGSLEGRQFPPFAAHNEARGESLHAALASSLDSQAAAAGALSERGVPGIRYLDEGSRNLLPTWSVDGRPVSDLSGDPLKGVLAHLQSRGGVRSVDEGVAQLKAMGTEAGDRAAALLEANRDRLSVAAPPATSNYVVFNPSQIEILRKYGIAAPVVGGAAAADQGQ